MTRETFNPGDVVEIQHDVGAQWEPATYDKPRLAHREVRGRRHTSHGGNSGSGRTTGARGQAGLGCGAVGPPPGLPLV